MKYFLTRPKQNQVQLLKFTNLFQTHFYIGKYFSAKRNKDKRLIYNYLLRIMKTHIAKTKTNIYLSWKLMRAIVVCCILTLTNELHAGTHQQTPAEFKRGNNEQSIAIKSADLKKTNEYPKQDHERDNEAADNERELIFWTFVIAIATCFTVAVGIIQLYMFLRQLRVMNNDIKLARDEFNASHRPWVKCKVVLAASAEYPSAVRFDQSGMYLTLKFTMENTGTAPALNVFPEWKIALRSHTRDFYIEMQRKICDEIKTRKRERGKYSDGLTIFPSETVEIAITGNIAQTEIETEALNDFMNEGQSIKTITVNVIGCIDYRSAINLTHHQTGFSYYVCAAQMDGGNTQIHGPLLPMQSEPIPMSDLYLYPNYLDGHLFFAD